MGRSRTARLGAWIVLWIAVASAFASGAIAKSGDIVVGDSTAGQVLLLKPASGNISLLSADPRLAAPNDSAFGPDGTLYFTDYGAFGDTGAVFAINPDTGKTSVVVKESPLEQPDGIARGPNGDLFVTDLSANGGSLFRVKLPSGHISLVSSSPKLAGTVGVVVPPDGKPVVDGVNSLVRVNPSTGHATTITDGSYTGGDGVALGADGTLYAVDGGASKLLAVNPLTGDFTIAAPTAFSDGYSLGFDYKGRVITGDNANVWAVNPATNANTLLSSNFSYAEGEEVVPPTCDGHTATIVGTTGNDVLKGSKFDDVIAGLGGNDKIKGAGGDDRICGAGGRDNMNGGPGDDSCSGGPGHDVSRRC